ncbi:MAG: WD40 repeat domain-containing protein [Thermoplasmata archaeon]
MNPKVKWEYSGKINSLKISKDGKRVCFSDDTGITIADTESGKLVKLPLRGKFVFNLSPDGTYLLISTEDGYVRMYSHQLVPLAEEKLPVIAKSIYISSDSSKIAVGAGRTVYLFDARLKPVWNQMLPVNVVKVKLDNAGYHLACVDAGNLLTLYDPNGKICFARMFNQYITNLSLSSASEYVLVATLEDRIYLMDTKGTVLEEPRFSGKIRFAKISTDGTKLLICFPTEIQMLTREFTLSYRINMGSELYLFDAADNLGFVCGTAKTGGIYAFHPGGEMWRKEISGGAEGVLTTPGAECVFAYSKSGIVKIDNLLSAQENLAAYQKKIEIFKGYGYNVSDLESLLRQANVRLSAGDYATLVKITDAIEKNLAKKRVESRPHISGLGITNENFRQNDWSKVLLYLMNDGNAHCSDIRTEYSQNILLKIKPLPLLLSGEISKQVIGIKPLFTGIQRAWLHLRFWNFEGREFAQDVLLEISAGNKPEKYEKPVAVIKFGNWEGVFRKIQETRQPAAPLKCPKCEKEVAAEWVACPFCMTKLKKW